VVAKRRLHLKKALIEGKENSDHCHFMLERNDCAVCSGSDRCADLPELRPTTREEKVSGCSRVKPD